MLSKNYEYKNIRREHVLGRDLTPKAEYFCISEGSHNVERSTKLYSDFLIQIRITT